MRLVTLGAYKCHTERRRKMKLNKKLLTLTILLISATEMGAMGIAPSLASIAADFPGTPITTIMNIMNFPGIAMIIVALITPSLIKVVPKKILCNIGVLCYAAIGPLGYLFNSSVVLLYMWAGLLGIGFGLLMPTSNGLIADFYAEEERGGIMGMQTMFTNLGGIYLTYVGGMLAAISWHMNYLAYCIGFIPFVLGCLVIPKENMEKTREEINKQKTPMNPKVFMYGIFIFIFIATYGVFNNNMSFLIESRGIGDAATSGTVTALFLVGGVLGGIIFGPLNKKLNDYMYCVGFGFLTAGYLIVYAASSLPVLFIGAVISGMSISQCMPQSLLGATNCSKVAKVTAACMVIHVGGQLGTFLGTYFYTPIPSMLSDAVDFRYVFAAMMAAVMVVVCAICITIANKKEKAAK